MLTKFKSTEMLDIIIVHNLDRKLHILIIYRKNKFVYK